VLQSVVLLPRGLLHIPLSLRRVSGGRRWPSVPQEGTEFEGPCGDPGGLGTQLLPLVSQNLSFLSPSGIITASAQRTEERVTEPM
jgi:hypothetical protein